MNRRNFLQLLGAVALCGALGITPAVRALAEDEDRRTRLARLAQDHADQLEEMRRMDALRLAQIEEEHHREFQWELDELERRHNAYLARQQEITDCAVVEFDRWWARLADEGLVGGA